MGGLAGFPFGGVAAFTAMAKHIPDDGHCFIVYGPHVGVDADGTIGKVNRIGMKESGKCCGSADAASTFVMSCSDEDGGSGIMTSPHYPSMDDIVDAQQAFVNALLLLLILIILIMYSLVIQLKIITTVLMFTNKLRVYLNREKSVKLMELRLKQDSHV